MLFDLGARLRERREADLYRERLSIESKQGPEIVVGGARMVSFCSNDYLGLAAHPLIEAAFVDGARRWGVGGGASHLVCGHFEVHHALEEALARFTGRESALFFSSGFAANLAVLTVLGSMATTVLQDRLNHASLLDGGRLSGARMTRYLHADCASLERALEKAGEAPLIVTDGVFSMDGDVAPLPRLIEIANAAKACLVVDDAHGFGVLGAAGGGCCELFGVSQQDVPVLVGTMGKAFGTAGAFVSGSKDLTEALIQFANSYIYTTSLPPAVAAATLKALEIAETESGRRDRLSALIAAFRSETASLGLTLADSPTAIQPIMVGDSAKAVAASAFLESEGLLVRAIRPPTVPKGTARLRVTLTAAHTDDHLNRLLEALEKARRKGLL